MHLPRRALPLVALLLLALAPAPASADRARVLWTAREAAEDRVRLVIEAREEILAESFIVGDDALSLTGLAMLRDAARRGVKVKLLIDAQWNKMPVDIAAHLLAEGVEIKLYHPFRWHKLGWLTRRLHDKLLVVDGQHLIVGGRNIESPYFDLGRQIGRRDYLDCDLRVDGEVASTARDYFLRLWESREVRPASAGKRQRDLAAASRRLDEHQRWLDTQVTLARDSGAAAPPPGREVGAVRFLHDPIGRRGQAPGVGDALLELFDSASESARIESPYLVPSRAFRRSLVRAHQRGLAVRILTNSLATTDNLFPQAGYASCKKFLLRNGMELWELTGERTLHSKVAVFDRRIVVVGSFNLDPRSEHLNTELALVVGDPALAEEMLAALDAHLDDAVRIDASGRPEGATERYPGVSWVKVCAMRLLRLLTPFIRKQL